MTNKQTTLHRVYRYGAEGGSLSVQVSPVASEVRVGSKQVVSFGDERIVLGINFVTEISRTGLFQLSFPLPAGLEVESLTGEALHHWSELTEKGQRQIVLHLKGKTIGAQKFSLTLAGTAPNEATQWTIPRFETERSHTSVRRVGRANPSQVSACEPSRARMSPKRTHDLWAHKDRGHSPFDCCSAIGTCNWASRS